MNKNKNKYNIKVVDSKSGEIKLDVTFHNMVTYRLLSSFGEIEFGFPKLSVGGGSGTVSQTDTALFSRRWDFAPDAGYSIKAISATQSKLTATYTIPANSSYTGTITELGLWRAKRTATSFDKYSYLMTHALLQDSEGNPLTIDKTETDKVIITVEYYFESNYSFDVPSLVDGMQWMWRSNLNEPFFGSYPCITLCTSVYDEVRGNANKRYAGGVQGNGYGMPLASSAERTIDSTNGTITFSNATFRIAEKAMPIYFKGICFSGYGAIALPNESIFPAYTLPSMSVGIGDGVSTEFKCPLNYFKKDTDKVYINGVLQERGVNYVIDNEANQDELIELSAGSDAITTTGGLRADNRNNFESYHRIFSRPFGYAVQFNDYTYNNSSHSFTYALAKDSPVEVDLGAVKKLNLLRVPATSAGNIITIYGKKAASDEYALIASGTTAANEVLRITFEEVEYRYIKITATVNGPYPSSFRYTSMPTFGTSTSQDSPEQCLKCYFLGRVGHGIIFTNPPAADAEITMTADIDLPMVNPNHVLDVTASFTIALQ